MNCSHGKEILKLFFLVTNNSNVLHQSPNFGIKELDHLGSNICCFWMTLKFHCKLKYAQIAKHVLMRSIYSVCTCPSLMNLSGTLHLGLQILLCFSLCRNNIAHFFHSDPSFKDTILGMVCLSPRSLFYISLECSGMYVNTFQSQDWLF